MLIHNPIIFIPNMNHQLYNVLRDAVLREFEDARTSIEISAAQPTPSDACDDWLALPILDRRWVAMCAMFGDSPLKFRFPMDKLMVFKTTEFRQAQCHLQIPAAQVVHEAVQFLLESVSDTPSIVVKKAIEMTNAPNMPVHLGYEHPIEEPERGRRIMPLQFTHFPELPGMESVFDSWRIAPIRLMLFKMMFGTSSPLRILLPCTIPDECMAPGNGIMLEAVLAKTGRAERDPKLLACQIARLLYSADNEHYVPVGGPQVYQGTEVMSSIPWRITMGEHAEKDEDFDPICMQLIPQQTVVRVSMRVRFGVELCSRKREEDSPSPVRTRRRLDYDREPDASVSPPPQRRRIPLPFLQEEGSEEEDDDGEELEDEEGLEEEDDSEHSSDEQFIDDTDVDPTALVIASDDDDLIFFDMTVVP